MLSHKCRKEKRHYGCELRVTHDGELLLTRIHNVFFLSTFIVINSAFFNLLFRHLVFLVSAISQPAETCPIVKSESFTKICFTI